MSESSSEPAPPTRGETALLVASLMLVGLNLRPAFSGVGPILPDIIRGTGLSTLGASLFTTIPVLCLGLFALLAPAFARRWGTERAVSVCLAFLVIGTAARGVAGNLGLFVGFTVAGATIGMMNVLLPGMIKRSFGKRAALMMGVHTMMLCAGAALGAAVAVPLEKALSGSWQAALAFWAAPAAAALILWLPQLLRGRRGSAAARPRVRGIWRDPLAWRVTIFMSLQSAAFYAGLSWFPPILQERGLSPEAAGWAISISIILQLVSSFGAPPLATMGKDQRWAIMLNLFLFAIGVLGFLFAPVEGIWIWAVILGIGQGGTFALALTLIVLRAKDAHVAAELSGMVQGVGYAVAATGPFLTGLIYGGAGGTVAVAVMFIAMLAIAAFGGWGGGRSATIAGAVESAPA